MSNSSVLPSARDLLLVLPRLAQRAGSFALYQVPEAVDSIAGKILGGGSAIAAATGSTHTLANATMTNTSSPFVQSTAMALGAALKESLEGSVADAESSSFLMGLAQGFARLKNFGGIYAYLTSTWAVTTFAVAIILNRTQFYASSREHLQLKWHVRLGLYAIPIAALLAQTITVLQALRCQTSPDYPLLRHGDPLKRLAIDFGADGGFLHYLSSKLIPWQDDAAACSARNMSFVGAREDRANLRGSSSLLFPFFLTLCTSQWFETLACALQGRQAGSETGMTIFEHSLAFAEAEAMLSGALGFDLFGRRRLDDSFTDAGVATIITRQDVMPKLNVPPEVLLVCLISCFSHLSSAVLAVLNIRHRVRLVNTAIWAFCYMYALIWSFTKLSFGAIENTDDSVFLRFPTVCIVGFIPHMLIVAGTFTCGIIYVLAILVTALSVPQSAAYGITLWQRLTWAYNNLQANVQFSQNSAIRIRMSEDFYTTLLKIGFNVLTAASEAVYLNEGNRIEVARMTWIEQKRIDDMAEALERRRRPNIPPELLGEGIARGVGFIDSQNSAISQSPYARERKSRPTRRDGEKLGPPENDTGLGLAQRRTRMQFTFDFVAGIFWLVVSLQAYIVLKLFHSFGIHRRPLWLLKAAGVDHTHRKSSTQQTSRAAPSNLQFYTNSVDGRQNPTSGACVDVEAEMRHRQQQEGIYQDEETFGESVYEWWRQGGWFGDVDNSGDFQARDVDEDTTSIISISTDDDREWEEEEGEDGSRTPTQRDAFAIISREATPVSESGFDLDSLSRLLDPQDSADRDAARLLSHSLQSLHPMTRNRYRRTLDRHRAELLSGLRASTSVRSRPTTEEEEEQDLERFILSQRSNTKMKARRPGADTWESGAAGMGSDGPQCVVCQSTPRTILVWPCGCLSLCDECRVGLAVRNHTKCICCRTEIAAYSRLFVP